MTLEKKKRIFTASFFDSVRSREAGENPARPPPLSPGTPRARNHWTREIGFTVARPGRSPTADDPEARRPAGRKRFLRRGKERGRAFEFPTARDALFARGEIVSSNGRFE
jgi:hypothetical protein